MNKYLDWQKERGALTPLAEFARYLEVGDKALSTWLNGRNNPSYKTAVKICTKLGDNSLLDILGYSPPELRPLPYSALPPEFAKALREAELEIINTLKTRGISENSPAAELLSREILEKYLSRLISTTKSGNESE